MSHTPSHDVAVVGGGLAGLAAATLIARTGFSVILFERSPQPGGRATTQTKDGFYFNQGPHALYRGGHGIEVLRELGVSYAGTEASAEGSWAVRNGAKHALPRSAESLAATSLFSTESKTEAAAILAGLGDIRPEKWNSLPLRKWLQTQVRHDDVRTWLEALFRLSTYCNDPDRQSAGAALTQLLIGAAGVDYLDHGWQTLVDRLKEAAIAAGVRIETRAGVEQIRCESDTASIFLAGGRTYSVSSVVATAGPAGLARLVNGGENALLQKWADEAIPVHTACLDIGLRRLPCPENQFAIGLDQPLYYSVHTRSADLAPAGGALIQLAKYLPTGSATPAAEIEQELESLMDLMQPGWRDELAAKRYLPQMLVANSIATAAQGGLEGRPGPAAPEMPNLFLAGDWVGPHGMLVDASLASARQAARMAAAWLRDRSERSAQLCQAA